MSYLELNKASLDEFVRRSDELGGPSTPGCADFWTGLQYSPDTPLDKQCEPLSHDYYDQQIALYREMTGHDYKELEHEFTPGVPVESLLSAPNAYGFMAPHEYARHCVALGMLVNRLSLSAEETVLELGSGWGFCQEFLASCGLQTTGIDVNPDFVCTSNQRLDRLGFGSRVRLMPFGDIGSDLGLFDVVLSYEAFHHAVDPLALLRRCVDCLRGNGRVVLAAEPFNNFYHSWGLRLDPYSVYCINKYGWFESGWSAEYMSFLFAIAGLEAEFIDLPVSDLTRYMIGSRTDRAKSFQLGLWHPDVKSSVIRDGDHFFCSEETRILIPPRDGMDRGTLELESFSGSPLKVELRCGDKQQNLIILPGLRQVEIDLGIVSMHGSWVSIRSETFCPAEQGINTDSRILGVRVNCFTYAQ